MPGTEISLENVAWATMGSFVLQAFLISQKRPIINFLQVFNRSWHGQFATFTNAVVFSIVGGLVGCGLVQPTTSAQALSAGLGWIGLVASMHPAKADVE